MKVTGVFNGTGAAVYLCVGFLPRKVRLWNLVNATEMMYEWWAECMRDVTCYEGWLYSNGVPAAKTAGQGIRQYEGGDLLTSSNQTSVTYGDGVYLGFDLQDYRQNNSYGPASGKINAWTLGSSANRTGNWNTAILSSGARIGAGSRIRIKEDSSGLVKEAGVVALSNQGAAANEVTLSRSIGSGQITFLGGMYDLAPIALGKVTPAGILLSDTTFGTDNDNIAFEMED